MAAWTLPQRIAEWTSLLSTGLDRRSRNYLPVIVVRSSGRKTVSSWLRAVVDSEDWQDHHYLLQTLGRSTGPAATQSMLLAVRQIPVSHVGPHVKRAIDDSPTKRYGPKVELAGIHHNPTPGLSGSEWLYGHESVTISWLVSHPLWGCIGLPLRALMSARQQDLPNVGRAPWSFRTKLELAAELVEWCAIFFQNCFRRSVMVIADGTYAKRPFLSRVKKTGAHRDQPPAEERRAVRASPAFRKTPKRTTAYLREQQTVPKSTGQSPHGWTQIRMKLSQLVQTVPFKTILATYHPTG